MLMYEAAGIDVVETQSFLAADLYAPRSQAGYVVVKVRLHRVLAVSWYLNRTAGERITEDYLFRYPLCYGWYLNTYTLSMLRQNMR
jgi:hypothetical protein